MTILRRHPAALAALCLLAALLPSLTGDGHGPSEHPAAAGFADDTVFLTDHAEADRTLHIEAVFATAPAFCQGCLLPKKQAIDLIGQLAAAPRAAPGGRLAGSPEPDAILPPRSPRTARAPPARRDSS